MRTKKNIDERSGGDAGAYAHCGPWAAGLRLWRTVPADRFGPAECAAVAECMRRTSFTIEIWRAAIGGDAPSAVRLALHTERPHAITPTTDVTMTLLLNAALAGSAGAALVLSHVLRQMPLDDVERRRLATCWLAHNIRQVFPRPRPRRRPPPSRPARRERRAEQRRVEKVMKMQIFSDLHAGIAPLKRITVAKDVDVAVVAGDVAEGAENSFAVIREIVPERIPVIFVMGNHEYYRRFLGEELAFARAIAPSRNVFLLENDTIVVGGVVRFAGSSLWTDYRMFGDSNAPAAMHAARCGMNDHRLIGWKREPWARFRPQEAALLHAASRSFFAKTFASAFDGITVAVSHHAPDIGSVPARYTNDILSAAFASTALSELNSALNQSGEAPTASVGKSPDLWIHGHIHDSADYRVGPTRVIANPHGYGRENANFDRTLIIEVPS